MNCNNSKCKKEIRNYYTCSKCGKSFCTNHCMTEHTLEFHGSSIPASRGPPQRNSGSKSFFMKIGKYTKEIIDDPNYIYENFELVKGKNGKCLDPLGSGAFGEVFKAKHKKDGKVYAIKQIEKEKIKETDCSLEVIYREISIHRRLFHENIVKLYSHHEDEENIFLLMDYSNSGTLFNLIKKSKGLDEKRAFKFFIQTVAAVHFLHENYLIHRDLKPENLLVDENETVRLCDFGWCVDVSTGSRITFCGTYEYMAPELLKELPYDYSIDIWSLGILLYELLHGYSPFRAQNSEDYDEYSEIFKNIIKYNFKIEKDISKNCSDLLTSKLNFFNFHYIF